MNDIHGINVAQWLEAIGVWAFVLPVVCRRVRKWLRKRQAKRDAAVQEFVEDVVHQTLRDTKAVI